MKYILRLMIGLSLVALVGCGSSEAPLFRISNLRATKANLQIQTTGGNTININDVQSGQTTAYQAAAAGQITATASIQGETVSPTTTFTAEKDKKYTIAVAIGTTPTLAVSVD